MLLYTLKVENVSFQIRESLMRYASKANWCKERKREFYWHINKVTGNFLDKVKVWELFRIKGECKESINNLISITKSALLNNNSFYKKYLFSRLS